MGSLVLRSVLLWQGSYWCAGDGLPPVSSPLPPGCGRYQASLHSWGSHSPRSCRYFLPLCSLHPPVRHCFPTASTVLLGPERWIHLTVLSLVPLRACRAALLQDPFQAWVRAVKRGAVLCWTGLSGVWSRLGKTYLAGFQVDRRGLLLVGQMRGQIEGRKLNATFLELKADKKEK